MRAVEGNFFVTFIWLSRRVETRNWKCACMDMQYIMVHEFEEKDIFLLSCNRPCGYRYNIALFSLFFVSL